MSGWVPPLFARLVDDAGLFPPESLSMHPALARHRADERTGHPMLTHRFLCPAARLAELLTDMDDAGVLRVGLLGADLDELLAAERTAQADGRVLVELAELALPAATGQCAAAEAALRSYPADRPPLFLELARLGEWLDAVRVAGAGGTHGVKLRCGGARAELFPSVAEVAAFITACAASGTRFKATAGLHRAVRHTDPATGFVHHGYLNLLCATAAATSGQENARVGELVAETEPARLVAEAGRLSTETAARARALFVSYGSCSTAEPIAELAELELDRPVGSAV